MFDQSNLSKISLGDDGMNGRMMSDRELSSVEIRQGFICPFCLNDLGSVELLQAHVTELHPNPTNTDNNDVLMHVKGFFDKAKQRIRNFDTTAAEWTSFTGATTTTNVSQQRSADERQSIGATRTHSDYFRASRDQCVNQIAVATNNLIIRLDKLVNECPADLNQRREFERAIVPWTSDSDCTNCRVCASKFSITRRRHHCRLCGKIMCNSCSKFLSFLIAKKLTNPAFAAEHRQQQLVDDDRNRIEQQQQQNDDSTSLGSSNSPVRQLVKQKTGKLLSATLSLMKRDGSEVSLSSLLDQDAEEHLRICFDCKTLLDRRDEMMDLRATPPIIVQWPAFTSVKNSVSS